MLPFGIIKNQLAYLLRTTKQLTIIQNLSLFVQKLCFSQPYINVQQITSNVKAVTNFLCFECRHADVSVSCTPKYYSTRTVFCQVRCLLCIDSFRHRCFLLCTVHFERCAHYIIIRATFIFVAKWVVLITQ